ncbi:MAG: siphovirus Gp157 family protein [Bryobacteraceae bacterium]|nr:siphovirus Gp157 family protein [Bryobacteraceae bacterium]
MATVTVPRPVQSDGEGRGLTLFEIDRELDELLDDAEAEAEDNRGQLSEETKQAIEAYLEALHKKVDAIAGYVRYQEIVAETARREEQRLAARKRAAENRVKSLKEMLVYFLLARGLKKMDGELNTISLQKNGQPSLAIDDPSSIPDCFHETSVRFRKTELQALVAQLPDGELRQRLEQALQEELDIAQGAVRSALLQGEAVTGARLYKGHHIRLR